MKSLAQSPVNPAEIRGGNLWTGTAFMMNVTDSGSLSQWMHEAFSVHLSLVNQSRITATDPLNLFRFKSIDWTERGVQARDKAPCLQRSGCSTVQVAWLSSAELAVLSACLKFTNSLRHSIERESIVVTIQPSSSYGS
jgi:hypothetical protein